MTIPQLLLSRHRCHQGDGGKTQAGRTQLAATLELQRSQIRNTYNTQRQKL